jgi:hypothetical protein
VIWGIGRVLEKNFYQLPFTPPLWLPIRSFTSICGVSKNHIRALTEGSNATHLIVKVGNME